MKDLLEFLDKYNIAYTAGGERLRLLLLYLEDRGITTLPESIGRVVPRKTV